MSNSIHQFKVKKLSGEEVKLSDFKGKVLLIVNIASKCGFTPQLSQLQELYEGYEGKDFEILAFPSNDFKNQEPLEGDEIQEFCQVNYGVTFPVFEKTVVKGQNRSPLYAFLSSKKENGQVNSKPMWNFHKYLVDKNGQVIDYFYTFTKPTTNRVKNKINKLLNNDS